MPVAAYGGSKDLMQLLSPAGPVYQAGTLSGNPLGMAAGIATLQLCAADGFYESLQEKASVLTAGLQHAASSAGVALQAGSLGGMLGMAFSDHPVHNFTDAERCDHEMFARFFHAMLERGVWLPPSGYEALFISSAHDEHAIERVVSAARESMTASLV
jgi:glutamate-1-semialdehyde 2,1-aminomutase